MAFIPVENTLRVKLIFTGSNANEALNVIHVSLDEATPTPTLINGVIDILENWAETEWAPLASNQWRLTQIEATDLTSPTGFQVIRQLSVVGTKIVDALPPQNTIAISLRSNFTGRDRRGRLYHVGLCEDQQINGVIDATTAADLISAYDQLRLDLEAATFEWVVVSFVDEGQPRVQGQTTPITQIVLTDLIVDSMDTRKPR